MHCGKIVTASVFAVLLLGCNTMEGVGEDLEQAGETIEKEAEEGSED